MSKVYASAVGWFDGGYTTYLNLNNFTRTDPADGGGRSMSGGRLSKWNSRQNMVQDWVFEDPSPSDSFKTSHEDGGNCLFADGHARYRMYGDFTLQRDSQMDATNPDYILSLPITSWWSVWADD